MYRIKSLVWVNTSVDGCQSCHAETPTGGIAIGQLCDWFWVSAGKDGLLGYSCESLEAAKTVAETWHRERMAEGLEEHVSILPTRKTWQDFSDRHALQMTPDEVFEVWEASTRDGEEGAEWLPYYKGALSLMAEALGSLAAVGEKMLPATEATMRRVMRLWYLHLVMCGAGPRSDDATKVVAYANGETGRLFACLGEDPQDG